MDYHAPAFKLCESISSRSISAHCEQKLSQSKAVSLSQVEELEVLYSIIQESDVEILANIPNVTLQSCTIHASLAHLLAPWSKTTRLRLENCRLSADEKGQHWTKLRALDIRCSTSFEESRWSNISQDIQRMRRHIKCRVVKRKAIPTRHIRRRMIVGLPWTDEELAAAVLEDEPCRHTIVGLAWTADDFAAVDFED
jgi:hypothetical protein